MGRWKVHLGDIVLLLGVGVVILYWGVHVLRIVRGFSWRPAHPAWIGATLAVAVIVIVGLVKRKRE